MTRKLASIRRIDDVRPIEGADAIECAILGGWQVVIRKGEYAPGDVAVYLEVDSWVPNSVAPFLTREGKEPGEFGGVKGERLRTIKLRGQISQGLLLPLSVLPHSLGYEFTRDLDTIVGDDVTSYLGVQKWEQALPAELAGQVNGVFVSFVPKTDEERCQNIVADIFQYTDVWKEVDADVIPEEAKVHLIEKGLLRTVDGRTEKMSPACADINDEYEVSMKMDGTSWTGGIKDGQVFVCSRNYELKINDENAGNSLVRMFIDSGVQTALQAIGRNVAIQGELMGPGIQGNREALKDFKLFVFNIFDIDAQRKMTPDERMAFMDRLFDNSVNPAKVTHAPILHARTTLAALGITDVAGLLKFAEGPSIHHKVREGLVFKRVDGAFSFKTISNDYLCREK